MAPAKASSEVALLPPGVRSLRRHQQTPRNSCKIQPRVTESSTAQKRALSSAWSLQGYTQAMGAPLGAPTSKDAGDESESCANAPLGRLNHAQNPVTVWPLRTEALAQPPRARVLRKAEYQKSHSENRYLCATQASPTTISNNTASGLGVPPGATRYLITVALSP